jgi:hypothetical protein
MSSMNRSKSREEGESLFGRIDNTPIIEFFFGTLGSLLLIAGTFAPLTRGRVVHLYAERSLTICDNGIVAGITLVCVGLLGLYLTLTRRFKYLWAAVLVSIVILAITLPVLFEMYYGLPKELYGDKTYGWWIPHVGWGLWVMVLGCLFMIAAAALGTLKCLLEHLAKSSGL